MSVDRPVPKGYRKAWNGGSRKEAMRLADERDAKPPETETPSDGGDGMVHSTWSGPSGIVHGWLPVPGLQTPGYLPACYPRLTTWPLPLPREELQETKQPITCQRCRKRLGLPGLVVTVRQVLDV